MTTIFVYTYLAGIGVWILISAFLDEEIKEVFIEYNVRPPSTMVRVGLYIMCGVIWPPMLAAALWLSKGD